MAKYCIECQGQKPMRENGIKIISYNGIEAKETEKWSDEENGTAINMKKGTQDTGYIWSHSRLLINLFQIYILQYLIFSYMETPG